jgi:hypothetical protein
MTAVIGIFNKSGVALAADSAVTVSNLDKNRKIYNTAYKIFTLSKFHPVGIMIYNAANYMGIPWEILIKEYRKKLGDNHFPRLIDYQTDFLKYLHSNLSFINPNRQKIMLLSLTDFIFKDLLKETVDENLSEIEKTRKIKDKRMIIRERLYKKLDLFSEQLHDKEVFEDFKSYTYNSFIKGIKPEINDLYDKYYSHLLLSQDYKKKLYTVLYYLIKTENFIGSWTGLVFAGYGEDEIYPSCYPIQVGEVFNNRIRFAPIRKDIVEIGDSFFASIKPFAQRDVIDTILSGIDTNLESVIFDSFQKFLANFINKLSSDLKTKNEKISNDILNILNIEELVKDYTKEIFGIQKNRHIDPLMEAVASFSKEDLAELSESLIYLTYLKRRMSFKEESVGGPVDVALITKGDGFVWIKRKHYFDINLNPNFTEKYLKF